MAPDATTHEIPTRREFVKGGGTIVGGSLLAGCSSDGSQSAPSATPTETTSDPESDTTEQSYTVSMAPMGDVEFESPPEEVFTILTHHAGMALALGYGDNLNAMHGPSYYQSLWSKFVHHLDGVTVDWNDLYSSWPPTREKLYDLDSDLHLADPAKVGSAENWDVADIEEVRENVAPWFGNTFSDTHQQPPEAWADDYEYYTLWEIFGKVAQVFQEQARYEALAEIHTSVLTTIEESLPPQRERPSAALVLFSSSSDDMWGYQLNHPGYYAAHTRPLKATDALAEAVGEAYGDDGGNLTLDYEILAEADPDVLLVLGPMSSGRNIEDVRTALEDHAVASQISAVEDGHVYTQGTRNQGPLVNLFQLEMTAKQLYPDQFGEWPGYANAEPYPEIPAEDRLFDRQQVADVVSGEFE